MKYLIVFIVILTVSCDLSDNNSKKQESKNETVSTNSPSEPQNPIQPTEADKSTSQVSSSGETINKTGSWEPLMMRSLEEHNQGKKGSGSEQHFHGITRSFYNPDYIYAVQDIAGPWRSSDAGETWHKCIDKGLVASNSDSIAVDPVNPLKLFVQMDNWNGYKKQEIGGLYLSNDGGDSWELVQEITWDDSFTFNAWDGPRQKSAYIWNGDFDVIGDPTASYNHRTFSQNINWSPVGVSENNSPENWYAAFPRNSLYYSNDGGNTWNTGASLYDYQFIYSVRCDLKDKNTVYIATEKGLLVSTDGGETVNKRGIWKVNNVARDEDRNNLVDFPRDDTFSDLHRYIRILSLEIDTNIPGKFWAVGSWFKDETVNKYYQAREWIFISYDYGYTWTEHEFQPWKASQNLPSRLFINPGDSNYIYVTNRWGFNHSISKDGGITWETGINGSAFPGFERESTWRTRINGGLTGFVPNPSDPMDVVIYSHATFWKSSNWGKTFNESSTGFNGIAWSWYKEGISFDPYNPNRIATFNCDVNVRITENNWDYFFTPENVEDINKWAADKITAGQGSHAGSFQHIENSNVIVATIGEYFKTRLMRSEDGGRNWALIENLPTPAKKSYNEKYWAGGDIYYVGFSPVLKNRVWAASMFSDDAGKTFNLIDFGLDSKGNTYKTTPVVLGYSFNNPKTVYAVGNYGKTIVRSDDSGDTWRTYNNGNVQVNWQVTWFDRKPFFEADPFNENIIYLHSRDGGVTMFDGNEWTDIFTANDILGKDKGNHVRSIATDPTNEGVIYIGCFSPGFDGIWKTTDRGITWENITENLPRICNSAMKVNPHTGELFLGSYIGTWVYPGHK